MFGIVSMNSLKISEMPPRSWESDGCLIYTLPKNFTFIIISVNNTLKAYLYSYRYNNWGQIVIQVFDFLI